MKMNQWVDFDTGDEAQSETVFSYMGKTYSIELSLSVGFGKDGMENFFSWLLSHPAKLYIFVAGNHELFLEDSLEQTISLLPKKVVFLYDSTFEFDGISFVNISMRSLQSKEQNVQSATKMDFLITHIPPEGILQVMKNGGNCNAEYP